MSRGSNISNLGWISNVLATSNPTTSPQSILGCARGSVTIRQTPGTTGVLTGNAQVQITDFGGGPGGNTDWGQSPLESDWVDFGTATALSGATKRIDLGTFSGKFLRVKWTDTGSTTANIDIAISLTLYV